jgi:ankyrin repeat protein
MAAWRKSQDLRYDERSRALLLRTLIDSDFLEALAHTPLHKSVLGLSLIPLEEHLRTSVSAINEIDAMGSTALCWAVYRNDHAAVAKLLASNASPNLGSRAPLIEAAMNGSVENMRALLSNGAHVSRQNQYGMSAIGKLCEYTVGTASHETRMLMARMLLNHGALINVRNIYGETPLMIAAGSAPLDMLQLLLSVSADVQIVDNEGYNALDWALNRKNQVVIGCLLERMRSLSAVSSVRLLDNVAECGHEQLMLLTETFSKKLNIDHIEFANRKGFWIHVYNKREDRTSPMDSAFKRLLENLQAATCKMSNTGNIEGIDQCPPLNMPGSWQDE